ncbi:MAG: carbohydrate porin [Candidatus Methylacidiphilales bacterium]
MVVTLRPFFSIQPDIPYIINPGAANQYNDAHVIGA